MTLQSCNFNSVPLNQSQQIRTPNLASFNYTNQDFWSMKARLIQYIKERFSTDFNDFVESELAILLIENWAFLADTLSFKMDQNVNELFIDTVTQVENAFRLCKLVGFQPTPPIASTAMFSATLNNVLATDLVIPTPVAIDVIANDVPTTFELFPADSLNNPLYDNDIIIPAGDFSISTIVGIEGRTIVQTFLGDGTPNQNYTLSSIPVIYDSVRVDVNGVRWQQVEYFTDSTPRREFRVEFDSNYQAFIIFGNNLAGMIPPLGTTINITYRTGGGTFGNIVSGSVVTQRNFNVAGFDFSIPVQFINYTAGQFGYNGDGIEEIRQKLPAYIRTQNRAVTGTDLKTLTDQFVTATNGQVGKSTAVLRNYGCAGNLIDLFILAKNGDNLVQASDGLKVELNTMLQDVQMMTDSICIRDGEVVVVDVTIDLTVDKFFKKLTEEILTKVNRRVSNFFSINNWEYGQSLKDTDIVKVLADVNEISQTTVSFITNDPNNSGSLVTTQYYQIIRSGTINISFNFI
jgi:hypothetical protein